MNDSLGDRMKNQYENRTRYRLPRRTYTIIRVDGKAFHSYTRGLDRPFDWGFMEFMNQAATTCCKELEGCQLAYVQSDEASFLLTDFGSTQTQAWFDGNLQKITSIAASTMTAAFNAAARSTSLGNQSRAAIFDARAFTIPDPVEVANYFIWRQQDALRNAISMAAQAHFSHKQLHGVSADQMQEMLYSVHGINFNDYPADFKRGRLIRRMEYHAANAATAAFGAEWTLRHKWETDPSLPVFTQDPRYLASLIPDLPRLSGDAETNAVQSVLSQEASE